MRFNPLTIVGFMIIFSMIINSCRDTGDLEKESIIYNEFNTTEISNEEHNLFSLQKIINNINYTILENTDSSMFVQIDKIKFEHGNIYILDALGMNHVFVFNQMGRFVKRIGKRGKGPGEYLRLCDFDVDGDGNIHLYDRQQMKMLIYDASGSLIEEKKTAFRSDGFNLLDNDRYIFSIAKESPTETILNNKLVITDANLNIEEKLFSYPDNFMDNKGNFSLFTENPEGILYNKPINDSVFFLSKDGKIIENYFFKFESKSVPLQLKNDFEEYIRLAEKDNLSYRYVFKTPILVKNYIIGNITEGFVPNIFCYDINEDALSLKTIDPQNFSHREINFPVGSLGDSVVVSYINLEVFQRDKDRELLNDEMTTHIKEGGHILCYYTLK